eukprot:jgi/Tetstr1/454368/TSEL_041275.t1
MVSVRKFAAATWRGENVVNNKWTIRTSEWLHDDRATLVKEMLEEHKLAALAGMLSLCEVRLEVVQQPLRERHCGDCVIAPPEQDEAIDLCEDIDAREEDVIDLLDDDEGVPPVATFKQMCEDRVKHHVDPKDKASKLQPLHAVC